MKKSSDCNDLDLDRSNISAISKKDYVCQKFKNEEFGCFGENADERSNDDINIFEEEEKIILNFDENEINNSEICFEDSLPSINLPRFDFEINSNNFNDALKEMDSMILDMYNFFYNGNCVRTEKSLQYIESFLSKLEKLTSHFDKLNPKDNFDGFSKEMVEKISFCLTKLREQSLGKYRKRENIKLGIINYKAKKLVIDFVNNYQSEKDMELKNVLSDFFYTYRVLRKDEFDKCALDFEEICWPNMFSSLVNFLNHKNNKAGMINTGTKEEIVCIIDKFIEWIGSSCLSKFYDKVTKTLEPDDAIIKNSKNEIDINPYNYFLLQCKIDKRDDNLNEKIAYIKQQIDILKLEDLSRLQDIDDRKLSNNPNHNFFGIKTEEFFSDTDQQSKNFVLHMRYAEIIQNNLCDLWDKYNKLFHKHKRESKSDPNSYEKANLYQKIKQERAEIYDVFRKFEAVKQKLLRDRLISIRRKKFKPLGKIEKFIRILLLIITFPIHTVIFILVKTLMKFFNCFIMGLEIISKFVNGCRNKIENNNNNCKDDWVNYCKEGYLDGIKINGKEICKRIRWWEKRWCRILRDILFPINLAIFIVIGIVLAIKKLFKSIIKVFVITARIAKDIYYDDPSLYMFKKVYDNETNSEIITNFNGNLSVMPDYNDNKNKIKIKDKFIDCKCPRVSYYDLVEKPKSIIEHVLCLSALKSIKKATKENWNMYAHKHSNTPRLDFLPEEYVVMERYF